MLFKIALEISIEDYEGVVFYPLLTLGTYGMKGYGFQRRAVPYLWLPVCIVAPVHNNTPVNRYSGLPQAGMASRSIAIAPDTLRDI